MLRRTRKKKVVLRKEDPIVLQVKLPPREEEFLEQFSEMNFLRYIVFKIDGQQFVVEKVGGNQETHEHLANSLPSNEHRYAVFDYDFTTNKNVQKSKIFFIAWSPETTRIRSKILYAISKDKFRRKFDGDQVELQATDQSEMSLDTFIGRAL
ncbi:Actin-depolymerizing factor 7 [Capsicum chinense]|nr:Actin-depolymerizing factor 7 [Capsicum chinense]